MKTLLTLVLSLTLTMPAFADYSGSAMLDWGTLTFSGVPIQVDTFGINVQETAYLLQGPGGVIHLQSQSPFDEFRTDSQAFTYAPLGSVSASADNQTISASVSLADVGDAAAFTDRHMTFQVLGSGTLTMSAQYTIQHAGIPPLDVTDFSTSVHTGIALGGGTGNTVIAEATLTPLSQQLQHAGLFTLSRDYQAGDSGVFSAFADVTTHRGGSVPLPGMAWLTGSGLVLLAVWRARRRVA